MTEICLPDMCDDYPDRVRVAAPVFRNYGGKPAFGGEIFTVKCHEDNSLVAKYAEQAGDGRVMIVDGGGSRRCALLGDNLAMKAADNGWSGVVVYGCIRDVDIIATIDLGVQALAAHPLKSIRRNTGVEGERVEFAGVAFIPGEYVYADNNGLLVSHSPLAAVS